MSDPEELVKTRFKAIIAVFALWIVGLLSPGLRAQMPYGRSNVDSAEVDTASSPTEREQRAGKVSSAKAKSVNGVAPVSVKQSEINLHQDTKRIPSAPTPASAEHPKAKVADEGIAPARDCGRQDVLGTSRTIEFGTKSGPTIGLKTYPQTLQLDDKEVVLTFDDGPQAGTTERVLEALRAECARATFFLIGRNAIAHKQLVWRELADGHSLGNHSWSHPTVTLRGLPEPDGINEIRRGFDAIEEAAAEVRDASFSVNFFRFPGFADTPPLRQYLAARNIAVFGADLWASDWRTMAPEAELDLLMERLHAERRGIILLHDTRAQTAAMLPSFLRRLKDEGYKVVHLEQAAVAPPELRRAPEGWTSETESILSRVMPRLTGANHKPVAARPEPAKSLAPASRPQHAEPVDHAIDVY
jgi:peptidoglycan-N-acetylglucosamine deacetylase